MRIRAIAMGRLVALMTLACLWSASEVQAAIVLDTPTGLAEGQAFRFIFVTTAETQGTSSDAAVYDAFARSEGSQYEYSGVTLDEVGDWFALVSTSDGRDANEVVLDSSDLSISPALYRIDGELVAASGAALWNTNNVNLSNAVNFVGPGGTVWTGSNPLGNAGLYALGTTFDFIRTGNSNEVGPTWTYGAGAHHESFLPIYAVSRILYAPNAAVPEPTSLAMLAMAGVGVLGGRSLRRRKAG